MARKSHHALAPAEEQFEPMLAPNRLTKQEFGRRLAHHIIERGWNQSDLHRKTKEIDPEEKGIGRDAVSNYVNGQNFPTPKSLALLCKALDVTREELLPNAIQQAMNDEHPALELRSAAGHPGKAWVLVNRMMSFETATKIVKLINEEDKEGYARR